MAATPEPTRSSAVPIFAVLGCVAALAAGGLLTRPNLDWYATLNKPGFQPPNRAFTIVWPILYAMMAVSAWLAWKAPCKDEDRKLAFIVLHPARARRALVLRVLLAAQSGVLFDRLSRIAALLLVPLALWVCYATALNFAFFMPNS